MYSHVTDEESEEIKFESGDSSAAIRPLLGSFSKGGLFISLKIIAKQNIVC